VGPVAVVPRERPEIEGFEIRSVAPGATAAVSRRFAMQEDDLRFLEGTGLTLDLQANEDLAGVVVGGADRAALRADSRGPRAFRIAWTHDRVIAFSVEVESSETHLRSHPRNLAIGMFRDTAPRVQLECLGVGDRVTAFARVPCRVDALDDLGIASARIAIATQTDANDSAPARSIEEPVPLGDQAGTLHLVAERALELGELGLQPGRHVRVVAFAKDGRHPEPQEGASRARILTIVPPEVLLAEIVLRLQAARSRLRTTLAEERELRDLMLAPLEPEAVGRLSKRFRVAERTLSSVRRAVEDGVREMALNRVLEDEGVALLQSTVTEPFAELERGLVKEQREAIEAGLAEGLPKAGIEAAHGRQLRIIAALEGILRGMDRWDTLVDLIAQLGEVIRLQTDARKNTQGAGVESRGTPRDK
jgi:hypothetical protein